MIFYDEEQGKDAITRAELCCGIAFREKDGRRLLAQTVLTKRCRNRDCERIFLFFNDILAYGTILIADTKYKNVRVIPWEDISVANRKESEFDIYTSQKSFTVFTNNAENKEKLVKLFETCCVQTPCSKKRRSSDFAPIWVPDFKAKRCMKCSTQFTFINRIHHCRKCGRVFCGNCSRYRVVLETISASPSRVCKSCNDDLYNRRLLWKVITSPAKNEKVWCHDVQKLTSL